MTNNSDKWLNGDDDREVSAGSGDASLASVAVATPRWRARPDGRQQWLRLSLDPASAAQLRLRAIEAGVTVDAWLGIALTYEQVRTERSASNLSRLLRRALASQPLHFAPSEKLRAWQRYLIEADAPGLSDELPEVVVGAGISSAAATQLLAGALRIDPGDWQLTAECELHAAAFVEPLPDYLRLLSAG